MDHTADPLRDLARSTEAFFDRFDVVPTIPNAIENLREEVAELIEAAEDGTDQIHIAEEAADVFVTVLGVCFAAGIDLDTLVDQIGAVIAKNDAKTHDTHVHLDGKIRRRVAS